jgi:hypothetical protein
MNRRGTPDILLFAAADAGGNAVDRLAVHADPPANLPLRAVPFRHKPTNLRHDRGCEHESSPRFVVAVPRSLD